EELAGPGLERLARARLVGISAPMHTAMAIGVRLAPRVRALNPGAHICFYGLYAALNRTLLTRAPDGSGDGAPALADTVLGGEYEEQLVSLAAALEAGTGT